MKHGYVPLNMCFIDKVIPQHKLTFFFIYIFIEIQFFLSLIVLVFAMVMYVLTARCTRRRRASKESTNGGPDSFNNALFRARLSCYQRLQFCCRPPASRRRVRSIASWVPYASKLLITGFMSKTHYL